MYVYNASVCAWGIFIILTMSLERGLILILKKSIVFLDINSKKYTNTITNIVILGKEVEELINYPGNFTHG